VAAVTCLCGGEGFILHSELVSYSLPVLIGYFNEVFPTGPFWAGLSGKIKRKKLVYIAGKEHT
jgi:hypothetical protein